GSGIALGLPANFRKAGLLADAGSGFTPLAGPGVVLSGSCSTASNAQVADYLQSHPGLALDAAELLEERLSVASAVEFVLANADTAPIVYSTAEPAIVRAMQERYGREVVAERIEVFFAELARQLVAAGVTRVVVGGGETSGAVVGALNIEHMRVGP